MVTVLVLCSLSIGCGTRAPQVAEEATTKTARVGRPVMGTVLEISVDADNRAAARRLAERALATAQHWEDVLTTWRADGQLAVLNRNAGAGWQSITAELATALERMIWFAEQTGGAFDPAVGRRVRQLRRGSGAALSPLPIGAALSLRPGEARLAAGVEIDAGGFGKGLALDMAAAALRRGGARAAFLDFGGSSQLAFGYTAGAAPLLVVAGLKSGEILGAVRLRDQSLSTSRTPASPKAGAIVDPRTYRAVAPPRVVTVMASDAATAETWSTALAVLGRAGIAPAEAAGVGVVFADDRGVHVSDDFNLESRAGGDAGRMTSQLTSRSARGNQPSDGEFESRRVQQNHRAARRGARLAGVSQQVGSPQCSGDPAQGGVDCTPGYPALHAHGRTAP